MVIAHFMVGAQKKMVLGPAGWLRNARNEEVVAILFVIGSVCACLSFFLSKSVSGSRREKNEDKERRAFPKCVCDLFWCASRETRERLYSHYHELLIYIYIYIYIHAYRCFNNERIKGPLRSVESAFPRRSGFLLF